MAITGTLDHAQMLANYRDALKNPAVAHPQYMRLDLERRTLQADGTWSDWQKVDAEKNLDILDNLPARGGAGPRGGPARGLVDPLPFLNAGLWEKVHIASLVPKEKTKLPEETPRPTRRHGHGGMGGMGGGSMDMQMQMQQSMMGSRCRAMMGGSRRAGHDGHPMMRHGNGWAAWARSEAAGNFWKSEEKKVMIRALDFTAEPDQLLPLSRPDRRLQPQLQPRRRQPGHRQQEEVRWKGPGARRPTS